MAASLSDPTPIVDSPASDVVPDRRRRWLAYTLFTLLLIALLPFLILCLVFCLKLFLAAVIITVVALLLIAGACTLYSLAWLASRMAQRNAATRRPHQDSAHPVGDVSSCAQ